MCLTVKPAAPPSGPRSLKRIETAVGHRINRFAVSQVSVTRLEALVDSTVEHFAELRASTYALLETEKRPNYPGTTPDTLSSTAVASRAQDRPRP